MSAARVVVGLWERARSGNGSMHALERCVRDIRPPDCLACSGRNEGEESGRVGLGTGDEEEAASEDNDEDDDDELLGNNNAWRLFDIDLA